MHVYNTFLRQKEAFIPKNPEKVGMYVCGPTVYDRAHIGNARAIVVFDTLFRLLQQQFGEKNVTYVRNITDVDDKINKAANERGISIDEVTETTTKMFHDDMAALGCLPPTIEPRATKHIEEMITMINTLIENGYAYAAEGHVLFSVEKYADYGKLSRRSVDEMLAGARVEIAPYKQYAGDFVLWKPSSGNEPSWESPWGFGRPGWHLECSAMSTKYLGENFDIHGGGIDLQFPHHENEIAQSCCTYKNSSFARYWIHNGFLTVNGDKMSKSVGNFITVHDLLDNKNIKGEVIRYALLAAHYRKPLDWNDKAASDAQKALNGFYRALQLEDTTNDLKGYIPNQILDALCDDLNTPLALSHMHQLTSDIHKSDGNKQQQIADLKQACQLLGLGQHDANAWFKDSNIDDDDSVTIEALIEQRKSARANKDWAESDRIRDELTNQGIVLEDKSDGTTLWRRA